MARGKSSAASLSLKSSQLLGEFHYRPASFPLLDDALQQLQRADVAQLHPRQRLLRVHEVLRHLISSSRGDAFLLPAALDYISKVNDLDLLTEPYRLQAFEFWLNQCEEISDEENYRIRGQLSGRFVPREEYQVFFPIGMGKVFAGSHFVAAHLSPDIDTAVASFWGWLDAFSARVSEGQHHWSLPTTMPDSHVQRVFSQLVGSDAFGPVAHPSSTLNLSSLDLLTKKHLQREPGEALSTSLDHADQQAIIYVDEEGYYLGDWRRTDVEPVRQILMSFKACLRWFENRLHCHLISLFAKEDLSVQDLPAFIDQLFNISILDCDPAKEFTERQKKNLSYFLERILGLTGGLNETFAALDIVLGQIVPLSTGNFKAEMQSLATRGFFTDAGILKGERATLFPLLEKVITDIDETILAVHKYMDRLDIAMNIKQRVLGKDPHYVTVHSDVEEMRIKMKERESITVVEVQRDGRLWPVGVVLARTLRKSTLGTVTQRDFCNRSESKMASYLEVISVVDHHKTSLDTTAAPMVVVGDAQSSNILVAELSFRINDSYSLGGQTLETIDRQLSELSRSNTEPKDLRLLQRLLQRKMVARSRGDYFVHPAREYAEYMSYLYAILDDTDLLTKVSARDVVCVGSLLNRLKSLVLGSETEIIHFDDIPRDENFARLAAQRILQNEDMYSLYRKIYQFKEEEVERTLLSCLNAEPSSFFNDTKEQNGCCRVGQTKIFSSNYPLFSKRAWDLRRNWLALAQEVHQEQRELDLHLHMISTVASAQEVYEGLAGHYQHQDELWIWVAPTQTGYDHLASFLSAFQELQQMRDNQLTLEIAGLSADRLERTFQRNFLPYKLVESSTGSDQERLPLAILRFDAGTVNSRKSMITPYLPHLVM